MKTTTRWLPGALAVLALTLLALTRPALSLPLPPPPAHLEVNARAYGCKGDGVADDTAALQSAINAAVNQNLPLYVPAGTYRLTSPVGPAGVAGFSMYGDGEGLTVLRADDTAFNWGTTRQGVLDIPGNSSNTYLGHFRVYGGLTQRPASQCSGIASGYAAGLRFSCLYGLIEHVEVFGFSGAGFDPLVFGGFQFGGSSNCTLVACRSAQNGLGWTFPGTCNQMTFYSCQTQSNGAFAPETFYSVRFDQSDQIIFRDCLFDESTSGAGGNQATIVAESSAAATRILFDGCRVYTYTSSYGIRLDSGSSDVTLRNCHVYPYGGNNNCTGAIVASGSTLTAYDSVIANSGAGKCVTGAGTFRKQNCTLTGTVDVTTVFGTIPAGKQALTYGTTVSNDPASGAYMTLAVTNTTAFTISNPATADVGAVITYDVLNSSGGTMGAITWGANFKLAGAFTNPASTKRRTIQFIYDGTNWVETGRAAADI